MTVTDARRPNGTGQSRNERLLAAFEAEQRGRAEWDAQHPEAAAHLAAAAQALAGGGPASSDEEFEARALIRFAAWSSLWCSRCKTVFNDGDVIHRKRKYGTDDNPFEHSWRFLSVCESCVSQWHPSWMEERWEPRPCTGGCGALISSWFYDRVRTCSRRCSERVEAERKRVTHQPRTCEHCGDEFVPARADARFCSSAHRQAAYRARQTPEKEQPR